MASATRTGSCKQRFAEIKSNKTHSRPPFLLLSSCYRITRLQRLFRKPSRTSRPTAASWVGEQVMPWTTGRPWWPPFHEPPRPREVLPRSCRPCSAGLITLTGSPGTTDDRSAALTLAGRDSAPRSPRLSPSAESNPRSFRPRSGVRRSPLASTAGEGERWRCGCACAERARTRTLRGAQESVAATVRR
jgi:hypothetical protein